MADVQTVEHLRDKSLEMRKRLLRLCNEGGGLHIGGDLSLTDVMTVIFEYMLHVDPEHPDWEERDRFVLSKGHGAGALYISMANRGFFDPEEIFSTYGKLGSRFGIHPCKEHLPGVEASTGSLGHGLSLAVGMALGARLKKEVHRVVTVIGDGECDEGSIWEAAMAASHYKLGNIVAFVDKNGLSLDGFTEAVMNHNPLDTKFEAFGWNVVNVDGHDVAALVDAVDNLPPVTSDKPTVIIAHTVKGKGVDFMENNYKWHAGMIDADTLEKCYAQVEAKREKERTLQPWPA